MHFVLSFYHDNNNNNHNNNRNKNHNNYNNYYNNNCSTDKFDQEWKLWERFGELEE